MSRRSLKVTFAALDTSRIPDALTKAALLLIDLNDRGVIAHMADRIKKPSRRTLRPDGERYEPMQVRVVASIFPKQGKATAGKLIDGWQVELFAIDAPASSWPAPEAVGAYFGRAGQENRYAQEDRELGLDRIVSYELPGQELASLVALSLWNLQIVSGFELEPVADEVRHKSGRCERVDERVPDEWPREPVVRRLVKQLDWEEKLDGYPGWSFCGDEVQVRCQAGGALPLERVQTLAHGVNRAQMLFRRPEASCQDCPQSQKCPGEGKATLTRHICIPIDDKIAKALYKRLRQLREHANQPDESLAPMVPESIGPYEVRHSLFLPAAARQVYAESFEQTGVRICVELGPSVPERPRLVALDVAEVQRRRKTWEQNVARYALPSAASVRIEISGGLGLSPRFKHLNRQETRQVRTG